MSGFFLVVALLVIFYLFYRKISIEEKYKELLIETKRRNDEWMEVYSRIGEISDSPEEFSRPSLEKKLKNINKKIEMVEDEREARLSIENHFYNKINLLDSEINELIENEELEK